MADSYVDDVLRGDALWTDIDQWIADWHDGESKQDLHDYLGMTREEYALWVEKPESLRFILAARERAATVGELLGKSGHEFALAARGLSEEDADNVRRWLEKTGRLPTT